MNIHRFPEKISFIRQRTYLTGEAGLAEETLTKTRYYCVDCGKRSIWEIALSQDYYQGVEYVCSSCGSSFYLPNGTSICEFFTHIVNHLKELDKP